MSVISPFDFFVRASDEKSTRACLNFSGRARIDGQMRADAVLVDRLDCDQEQLEFRVANTVE